MADTGAEQDARPDRQRVTPAAPTTIWTGKSTVEQTRTRSTVRSRTFVIPSCIDFSPGFLAERLATSNFTSPFFKDHVTRWQTLEVYCILNPLRPSATRVASNREGPKMHLSRFHLVANLNVLATDAARSRIENPGRRIPAGFDIHERLPNS